MANLTGAGASTMAELIQEYTTEIEAKDGTIYRVRAYADKHPDGMWGAWLEYLPVNRAAPVLRTGDETEQADLADLEYWASGLEPVYLDGALERTWPERGD